MAPRRKAIGLGGFVSLLNNVDVQLDTRSSTEGLPITTSADSSEPHSSLGKRKGPQDTDHGRLKRKKQPGMLGEGLEEYDATGLVPFYSKTAEIPPQLKKYFSQRERYFSLYYEGCLLDEEGWYSVTPELIANHIADRCRCDTILDAFCGVGGNAIAFAKTCERVIALDISPTRLALARHNAAIYGVADRIDFILCDYLDFARTYATLPAHRRTIDAVFLSPPWGGPEYISRPSSPSKPNGVDAEGHAEFFLSSIKPIPGDSLFRLTNTISKNVAYYLPRNVNLVEVSSLATPGEKVELEEAWMSDKLKAVTCYYGGLAVGQEHLF